jgi:hypothetical protein
MAMHLEPFKKGKHRIMNRFVSRNLDNIAFILFNLDPMLTTETTPTPPENGGETVEMVLNVP